MANDELVIDCDGHILEPPDLWERYLEPKYRDRALRIRTGDDGFEHLLIDGRPSTIARPGQLATLGGMGKGVDEARALRNRAMDGEIAPDRVRSVVPGPNETYLGGAAFGTMDMKERVQLLDREGMAKAVLYPTLGLLWEAELFDAEIIVTGSLDEPQIAKLREAAENCRISRALNVPVALRLTLAAT